MDGNFLGLSARTVKQIALRNLQEHGSTFVSTFWGLAQENQDKLQLQLSYKHFTLRFDEERREGREKKQQLYSCTFFLFFISDPVNY